MRHFKLFNSNFAFVQPATNLRFIGTLEPEFDRFLDHFFGVLRRFTLTDDAEFGTTRHIPSIFARLNHSGKLWKFHRDQVIPRSQLKNRGKTRDCFDHTSAFANNSAICLGCVPRDCGIRSAI